MIQYDDIDTLVEIIYRSCQRLNDDIYSVIFEIFCFITQNQSSLLDLYCFFLFRERELSYPKSKTKVML
jgi:hypothetical protein